MGLQKGVNSNTRSGLLFDALRIIEEFKPKIAIAENVVALVQKKFRNSFDIMLSKLEQIGYNNYWAVLKGTDFGIPQIRNRVFIVSIRKDYNINFKFPSAINYNSKLSDILEKDVDKKYYRDEQYMQNRLNAKYLADRSRIRNINQVAQAITSKGTRTGVYSDGKFRLLTPKEYFRLMDFDDIDIDKLIQNKFSDNQLYSLAGNSIIVRILEEIFKNIYGE